MDQSDNRKSPHILTAASNLLGFSFLAITSITSLGLADRTLLDEILGFCMFACAVSSLLSFASLRTRSRQKSDRYELIADVIFLVTLVVLTAAAGLLAVDIISFSH